MKALGYAVLLAGLVVGGLVLATAVSRMSRDECGRKCPTNAAALKTVFAVSSFELTLCNCGEVIKP